MSPVAVGPDTVVSLKIELALEAALEGKHPGESIKVQLEPEQAFGEYDANHPLAGMALRFFCTITAVRQATKEELSRREAFYRCDP